MSNPVGWVDGLTPPPERTVADYGFPPAVLPKNPQQDTSPAETAPREHTAIKEKEERQRSKAPGWWDETTPPPERDPTGYGYPLSNKV